MQHIKKIILKKTINESIGLVEYLAQSTGLSKQQIKKSLVNGGAWLKKDKQGKIKRVRRAQTQLFPGHYIEFYFDPTISFVSDDKVRPLVDHKEWGIWYKPAGALSQGTMFGDEGSLLREVEKTHPKTFLVHRLDREVAGPMIVAYTKQMANEFSYLLREQKIRKFYEAEVMGMLAPAQGEINTPIDGKESLTYYKTIAPHDETTHVEIEIKTGRQHQIRKHFESIGHPVMGDPEYGKGNKNSSGMKLMATRIMIPKHRTIPETNYILPQDLRIF